MHFNLIPFFFFFNDTATTEIYTLSLHDALPIYLAEPLHLARRLAHEGLERDETLDGVADLVAVLVRDLARRGGRLRRLGAVLRDPAGHLRQALRGLESPRDLTLLGQHAAADGARGLRHGARRVAQRLRGPGEGRERSEERRVGKECRSRWSPYH